MIETRLLRATLPDGNAAMWPSAAERCPHPGRLGAPRPKAPSSHHGTTRQQYHARADSGVARRHVYYGQVMEAEATMLTMEPGRTGSVAADELAALESIQRRVLWLASNMIHHANNVRPNLDGSKIGGHQASSSSVISILTALYFSELQPGDRVAVKPHASPAFHAVQYLLGNLPRKYLTELRSLKGIQAYPSKSKDPDPIDFSTGSVGLGAVAPAFSAAVARYAKLHFGDVTSERYIALLGDAELDEGNVWEAVFEDHLQGLGNLLWIVDLNRQSLDRVVPGIRAAQLKSLFRESGWHVIECKHGRRLKAIFERPDGEAL